MNELGSILMSQLEGCLEELHTMEGFSGQKESGTRKWKEWVISGRATFLEEKAGGFIRQIISPVLTRKFQTDWFKIPLHGETLNALTLGIKYWWGLVRVIPFWVCCFFLTALNKMSLSFGPSVLAWWLNSGYSFWYERHGSDAASFSMYRSRRYVLLTLMSGGGSGAAPLPSYLWIRKGKECLLGKYFEMR